MPFRERIKRVLRDAAPQPAIVRTTRTTTTRTSQSSQLTTQSQTRVGEPSVGPGDAHIASSPVAAGVILSLLPSSPPQSHTTVGEPPVVNQAKTVPEQLWDAGYARLRNKEPELVETYEKLSNNDTTPSVQELSISLENIEKLSKSRSKLENVDYVLKLRSVVAAGLKPSWEASLAWGLICGILEPLLNIGQEAVANRDGLRYIIERLEFNNKLSSLRLKPGGSDDWNGLQTEIRARITTLYMKILHYLIQSNIYHRQAAIKIYAKDSFKVYDWTKLLQDVKDAEATIDKDDALLKAEKNTANLQVLTNIALSQEDRECLRQLRVTDPRDDKKRIEKERGGLLDGASNWILDNDDFKAWRQHTTESNDLQQNNLLWIRGNPGKGKTMLLCRIINELSKDNETLAFFFCQATDPRINSAENVIRGLLYMLADKDPTSKVLPILREKFDRAGAAAFKDVNSWVVVKELFERTLEALSEQNIWLIVDALDECNQRDRLLEMIHDAPRHVKWLVSSRNWSDIEEQLDIILQGQSGLSLELNADLVAKAVDKFIDIKVSSLATLKRLNQTTADLVRKYLSSNAQGTFLWVALVCQSLSGAQCTRFNIDELAKKFPPGLDPVYQRILELIKDKHEAQLIERILSIAITVFRPLSVVELGHILADTPREPEYWEYIINQSGFLTSHSSQVDFLHLSAKEFLLKSNKLMVDGKTSPHQLLYERSIKILSTTLRRNPYAMAKVGCRVDDLVRPEPDPLASIAYSSLYWPHHILHFWPICSGAEIRTNHESLFREFCLKKYLYWIEALIWLESLSHGMHAMINLKQIFVEPHSEITDLYRDALRFILSAANVRGYPLQVYASTLFFSPTSSLIREAFHSDMPSWLESKHKIESNWPLNAISLKIYTSSFRLSPDWQKLVVMYRSSSVIHNAITGAVELEIAIEGGIDAVLSADSRYIIVATKLGKIEKYDCSTGRLLGEVIMENLQREHIHGSQVRLASMPNDAYIVHSHGRCLHCRDTALKLLREQYFENDIEALVLSPDASRLAITTGLRDLHLSDTRSGTVLWTKNLDVRLNTIVFSYTGSSLIGGAQETVYHWNTETGDEESRFIESSVPTSLVVFDKNLYHICEDKTIMIGSNSEELRCILREEHDIEAFAVTPYWLISLSQNYLNFYDVEEVVMNYIPKILAIDISPDGKRVACVLDNRMIRLWNMALSSEDIRAFPHWPHLELEDIDDSDYKLSFSYDDRLAVSGTTGIVAIWNVRGPPKLLHTFIGPTIMKLWTVVFAINGSYAYYSYKSADVTVVKKDLSTLILSSHGNYVDRVCTSNGAHIATANKRSLNDRGVVVEVWDITGKGHLLCRFEVRPAYFLFDGDFLCFNDDCTRLGYVSFSANRKQRQLRVMKTSSGQIVESVEIPPGRMSRFTYSEKKERFRDESLMLYPNDKGMELFVTDTTINVDGDVVLLLPADYYDKPKRISGNLVTHFLSADRISILEVDAEEAIRDETTRAMGKQVRPRAIADRTRT